MRQDGITIVHSISRQLANESNPISTITCTLLFELRPRQQ